MVWDLPYLHQYTADVNLDGLELGELTEHVILRIRGMTGWRSADLAGLFRDLSFQWSSAQPDGARAGVHVRLFNTKMHP